MWPDIDGLIGGSILVYTFSLRKGKLACSAHVYIEDLGMSQPNPCLFLVH